MHQPDDKAAQDAEAPQPFDSDARHLASWAATIERWARDGEQCFLVSADGLRFATSEYVSDAMDRLRERYPDQYD